MTRRFPEDIARRHCVPKPSVRNAPVFSSTTDSATSQRHGFFSVRWHQGCRFFARLNPDCNGCPPEAMPNSVLADLMNTRPGRLTRSHRYREHRAGQLPRPQSIPSRSKCLLRGSESQLKHAGETAGGHPIAEFGETRAYRSSERCFRPSTTQSVMRPPRANRNVEEILWPLKPAQAQSVSCEKPSQECR